MFERLLLLGVLLMLSGFFSGSETALFSLSRAKRHTLAAAEDKTSRLLVRLLAKPRRLIATLLIGNELVNISVGTVAAGLGERVLAGWTHTTIEIVVTLLVLPLILIVGEITPKSIALKLSTQWARAACRPIALFAWIASPVRWLIRGIAEAILFLLGTRAPQRDEALGPEELRALVDASSEEGGLEQSERTFIHNVFDFGDKTVLEVMTPVARVFALSYGLSLARVVQEVTQRSFSRVPIYKNKRENIVGILLSKDLVGYARGQWRGGKTLGDLLRPPFFIPKTTKLSRLFRQMQRRKMHMAVVVDEYGKMVGVVTLDDLLGVLFGELALARAGQEGRQGHFASNELTPVPMDVGAPPGSSRAGRGSSTTGSADVGANGEPSGSSGVVSREGTFERSGVIESTHPGPSSSDRAGEPGSQPGAAPESGSGSEGGSS